LKLIKNEINDFNLRLKNAIDNDLYFYLQEIASEIGPKVKTSSGKEYIMLGSYSYLGLSTHPKIKEAAKKAIDKYGSGAGGVRLLAGTTPLHNELELRIANFTKKESAILFSSGYVANLSTISTLLGKNDYILIDQLDHASIIDGCRLSGAKFRPFRHSDMSDLRLKLSYNTSFENTLICVDSVYSMDGDISDLQVICQLAEQYKATVMVDEAHSLGVIGKNGRGIEEHFNYEISADIIMGTFSKAIPSIGAFIASDKATIDFLKHNARAFVFSASLPPSAVAAALAALNIIEKEPWIIKNLKENYQFLIEGLKSIGYDTLKSETAIIPIMTKDEETTLKFCKFLFDHGIFISPIVFPAVPRNQSRLRAHVMATHTKEDLSRCLEIFSEFKP
jgi:glycine C-acetyltransferase